ncbi:hypothetical protein POTG_02321 [Paenibacillus sp. oral taxon 786 str. D14]|uniref:hypothetical protein n=1 Tax=unclassified Paenibacillus TaxID=185978 RepID=UPI0001AFDB98|nr:hypothetical protein [Paenibacillus sp. oral taxon 786]EES72914.1 hypothetical protein POTG_02321 [Paenibacillus sp. oral taxon 786 str. D14]
MPYFERAKKLSIWLILVGVVFFFLGIIFFSTSNFNELIDYDIKDKLLGKLITIFSFLVSIFLILLGIILKIIAKDAREDLLVIENRIRNEMKNE